jgi:sulfur carrier protein
MIELNGRPIPSARDLTLAAVLEELGVPTGGLGIAVAVNAEVIPRGEWAHFIVRDGAKLELVRAVQGG